ncbi:MAG: helix-turn-helix domain-containing protein [Streptosporangiaceae bacterium]
MCENPRVDDDSPAVAELVADVAAAVSRRIAAVSEDVYEVILREIPELRDDKPVLALLASSVHSNIATCLQVMRHQIDLAGVRAPAAALEYARRRAQHGTSLPALLRSYRLGHACFADWCLRGLAQQADDAQLITAATLSMSKIVAGYVDQTSEEIVAAYTGERETWLRNRSTARAARIRDLLSGERINASVTEATLGYRLRQYHVGVVCWTDGSAVAVDSITRLEHAISHVAAKAACADPVFLARDVSSAWAWLPLGIRDRLDAVSSAAAAASADAGGGIHFAFGDAAKGASGFRLTHRQALAAQAVALAAGTPPQAIAFGQVAPVAMMLGSPDLLRAWVLSTLADLAADDEHHARLRETLLVFLQTGGSYKTTAERLMLHKNTVQYRIRKAEESLGRPLGDSRHDVELALRASQWLGSSVLTQAGPERQHAARPRTR